MIFTNLGSQYASQGAEDIGYQRGVDLRNADESPYSRRNTQAVHQLEQSPDNWAGRGDPHVDLQALTQGSLAQDDILKAEMINRGKAQQTLQDQAEHLAGTDLATAQEDAARAKAGIDTQDPYYPQHLQSQTAIGVANAEGGAKIQAARQPRLVERETEQMRIQAFAQAKDKAFRELQKSKTFAADWISKDPVAKKRAQDALDQATQAITEPIKQGMTRYNERDTGFALN
jgi:hypothetical protein